MRRRLTVLCVVALASCGGDPVATSQMQITTIAIFDFYYSPASATVRAGTTIEWINHGPSAHTAIQVPASLGTEPCVARTLTSTACSWASQACRVSSVGSVIRGTK